LDLNFPSNFFSAEDLTLCQASQHPVLPAFRQVQTPAIINSGREEGHDRSKMATHTNPNWNWEVSWAITSYANNHSGCHVDVNMISQAANMTHATLVDQECTHYQHLHHSLFYWQHHLWHSDTPLDLTLPESYYLLQHCTAAVFQLTNPHHNHIALQQCSSGIGSPHSGPPLLSSLS
jgi:hypothetical protein